MWVLGQQITCLILAKWPFSTSLGRNILPFFFSFRTRFCISISFWKTALKTLLPVRLQLSSTLWLAREFHIESMGWYSPLLHWQHVPWQLTKPACCYWITYQGEELYLITSFTYHHWPLGISHKRCTGLWSPWNFKLQVGKLMHWHMFQALTCPLLQWTATLHRDPSSLSYTHTLSFTRR